MTTGQRWAAAESSRRRAGRWRKPGDRGRPGGRPGGLRPRAPAVPRALPGRVLRRSRWRWDDVSVRDYGGRGGDDRDRDAAGLVLGGQRADGQFRVVHVFVRDGRAGTRIANVQYSHDRRSVSVRPPRRVKKRTTGNCVAGAGAAAVMVGNRDLCLRMSSSPTPAASAAVPAVEVAGLRKEFRRRARSGTPGPRVRRVAAIDRMTLTMRRGETVAILGKNGSGKSTLVRIVDAAAARRRRGPGVRVRRGPRRPRGPAAGQPGVGGGQLLQEAVPGREPQLRGPVLRDDRPADPRRDPADPRPGRLPRGPPASRWRTCPAACSKRSHWPGRY